ncbi:20958_t:CDS:2, partial [Gigaspora rosea]
IQYDQYILTPIDVDLAPCPFSIEQIKETMTTTIYYLLLWALRLSNRVESLVYAFYLGSLFVNTVWNNYTTPDTLPSPWSAV